jgi:ubiquinone/menaquinone biosynthesis C-methylase UbiE
MEKSPSIENQTIENQTIVEIGPGINPIFELFENETFKKIGKGSKYIAIDCDQEVIKKLKFQNSFKQKGYEAMKGDLENLPLKNDSVDQIWLMNVFGNLQNNPKKLHDGTLQYSSSAHGIFQELTRVVKPKGKVYIGEIILPVKDVAWLLNADYSGFGLEKKVYKGDKEAGSFMEKMGGMPITYFLKDKHNYLPFFIELTKK